jgi:hypothetical protein
VDRYARDKFANRGEQVILDAAASLYTLHQQLPPEDAVYFADAVQLITERLKTKQQD